MYQKWNNSVYFIENQSFLRFSILSQCFCFYLHVLTSRWPIVTPPNTDSENRSKNVPSVEISSIALALCLLIKPITKSSFQSALKYSCVSIIILSNHFINV